MPFGVTSHSNLLFFLEGHKKELAVKLLNLIQGKFVIEIVDLVMRVTICNVVLRKLEHFDIL